MSYKEKSVQLFIDFTDDIEKLRLITDSIIENNCMLELVYDCNFNIIDEFFKNSKDIRRPK